MAGSASDYTEKKFADLLFGAAAFSAITPLYFALFTDSNTATQRDAGTVTEVSTGTWTNYARVSVTNNSTNFPAASGITAAKSNGTAIAWPATTSTGNVTVNAVGVYDALTTGNLLFWADLTSPQVVANSNTFSLAIGAFSITVD